MSRRAGWSWGGRCVSVRYSVCTRCSGGRGRRGCAVVELMGDVLVYDSLADLLSGLDCCGESGDGRTMGPWAL